ncbi:hypothetical protein PILCRDRAFT_59943 [Piloderma croceum F 1598]|uniref:tRNA N(3)-methylcytidine methyltransferase n=1 Tax=Piloderma croceum (strain F 1598) TaxID=765440 RepID=A0A0C3BUI2_PILCF|nr:hypothetical protein PILCRDRAFT_59943 [Piloderma croceum F 1598]
MQDPIQGEVPSSSECISRTASSVHDINNEKPPFGARRVIDEANVWSQNAWDHVPPPDDQIETITASLARQRIAPVPDNEKSKYNENPSRHWNNFYKTNSSNFFRNRKWLHLEFPELLQATEQEAGPITITEIGCGAGNAVFPILASNKNPKLNLHAYDYSSQAVKLVQTNALYTDPPVGTIHGAVWDLTSSDTLPPGVEPGTVDIVILVFVISALHPDEWGRAIANIHKILKPGGLVLFRDYGRHDLTQLRFKAGRLLNENFYIRGDKTRVYFFELGIVIIITVVFCQLKYSATDELALLFTGSQVPSTQKPTETTQVVEESEADDVTCLEASPSPPPPDSDPHNADLTTEPVSNSRSYVHPNLSTQLAHCPPHPLFTIEQLGVDRRLLVNRKRQLKMYRVWMQGKFRKLV